NGRIVVLDQHQQSSAGVSPERELPVPAAGAVVLQSLSAGGNVGDEFRSRVNSGRHAVLVWNAANQRQRTEAKWIRRADAAAGDTRSILCAAKFDEPGDVGHRGN